MDDRAKTLELEVRHLTAEVDKIKLELSETNQAVRRAVNSVSELTAALHQWQGEERSRRLTEYEKALQDAEKKRLEDIEEARERAEARAELRHLTSAIKGLTGTEDGLRAEVKRRTDREESRKTIWEWGDILVTAAAKAVPLAFLIIGGLWALFVFLIDLNALIGAAGG